MKALAGKPLPAVLAAGLTACGAGGPDRGRVLRAEERTVSLAVGDRFSIAVRDNASTGDYWSIVDPMPDRAVAAKVDEDLDVPQGSKTADGVGGTRYYTFEAKGRGSTTVTLFNCFRSLCHNPKLIDDEGRK